MEGYLKKWINPFVQWKQRYFILHDDCLIYADKQGGQRKGTIHLKIADVLQVPNDPLKIIINSGTGQIEVRADTVEQKINWFKAIKESQIKAQSQYEELTLDQLQDDPSINSKYKQLLIGTSQTKIEQLLVAAFEAGAQFESSLQDLLPKIVNNPQTTSLVDKLQNEAFLIRSNLKESLLCLESEKKRLFKISKVLASDLDYNKDNEELINQREDTMFESMIDNSQFQSQVLINGLEEELHENENNDDDVVALTKEPATKITQSSLISYFSKKCPIRHRLLTKNPSYLATEVSDEPYRLVLPKEKDPKEKINIWSIVKDSIGKDLAKFAVPVYLNEPTSMLQRLAEQMEYSETLDSANSTDDYGLAMCYVMAFAVSIYAGTINRTKKPFNPLLGETYEFIDEEKGYKFISEQVSHHPPISAGIATSKNYLFWGDSDIKSQFWGKSFEVHPLGNMHVKLKKPQHEYVFKKCTTAAKNIILGQIYLDHFGVMEFKNHTLGIFGELNLKEKGMFSDKGQYEIEGWVKDKTNKQLYSLFGHWNNNLTCTQLQTQKKTELWKRHPLPPRYENYYYYTSFSFQLNHLYKDLMKKIAPTDSRLRPDQRALEYGLLDIATEEKLRLEQKQRAKRKEDEKTGSEHKIVFFEKRIDPITGEKEYHYKGGYWEAREKGDWSKLGLLDIY